MHNNDCMTMYYTVGTYSLVPRS